MAGFLYYIPGQETPTEDRLRDVGLGYLLPAPYERRRTEAGPDGALGYLVAITPDAEGGESPETKYSPDAQEWRKCAGGKFWIGREKGTVASPLDLQRATLYNSYAPTLSDGNQWFGAVASSLPSYWGLDDGDKRVRVLKPEFAEFSAKAETAFKHCDVENMRFTDDWIFGEEASALAIEALQLNYRMGVHEANLLQLPSDQDVVLILGVMLDLPAKGALTDQEDAKKNE